MPSEVPRSEVEELAQRLAASELQYERGLAARLHQFLELEPSQQAEFARTHFSNADLNWFQGGANASDAIDGMVYGGERMDVGEYYRKAQAVVRGILDQART